MKKMQVHIEIGQPRMALLLVALIIPESQIKYLAVVIYKANVEAFFHVRCQLIIVPPVSRREYDGLHFASPCCYSFLFDLICSTESIEFRR